MWRLLALALIALAGCIRSDISLMPAGPSVRPLPDEVVLVNSKNVPSAYRWNGKRYEHMGGAAGDALHIGGMKGHPSNLFVVEQEVLGSFVYALAELSGTTAKVYMTDSRQIVREARLPVAYSDGQYLTINSSRSLSRYMVAAAKQRRQAQFESYRIYDMLQPQQRAIAEPILQEWEARNRTAPAAGIKEVSSERLEAGDWILSSKIDAMTDKADPILFGYPVEVEGKTDGRPSMAVACLPSGEYTVTIFWRAPIAASHAIHSAELTMVTARFGRREAFSMGWQRGNDGTSTMSFDRETAQQLRRLDFFNQRLNYTGDLSVDRSGNYLVDQLSSRTNTSVMFRAHSSPGGNVTLTFDNAGYRALIPELARRCRANR